MDYNCKVHVVDMMMGSGKSSAAINFMNNNKHRRYLFITPFLTEIERVIESCPDLYFVQPETRNKRGKLCDIKTLLSKGFNVVSTHALFRMFTTEIIDICRTRGYTLIMDEVSNVVEPYEVTENDMEAILHNFAYVDKETNLLRWREDKADYRGKYDEIKEKVNMQSLAMYGQNRKDIVMWLMPIQSFNAFQEIYILTYLFKGQIQRYYYDYFKLPYDYLYVKGDTLEEYEFTDEPHTQMIKYNYKNLIHICDHAKLNQIGELKEDLSKNWFHRNRDNGVVLHQLQKNLFNFFHNIQKSPTKNNIWTTFKSYRNQLSGKGYAKGFLQCGIRATNAYKDRSCVAYCLNKYINTTVKIFFNSRGIKTDEDTYATSEMLQFIWRSAIREGKDIWVYIPSRRMRELLIKWIEENPPTT